MLRDLVEGVGHSHEELIEGSLDEVSGASRHDPTLLVAETNGIEISVQDADEEEEEEDTDTKDEDTFLQRVF
jgi:hypothetical protein